MYCSRYNNDYNRIEKRNAISTFAGRYAMDVPGPGDNMDFNADPHLRISKWGANFRDNMMDINSDLRGLTRPLNRDLPEVNCYKKNAVKSSATRLNLSIILWKLIFQKFPRWSIQLLFVEVQKFH